MGDIYLACAAMAALSAMLFWLTRYAARWLPRSTCDLLAVLLVAVLFYYIGNVWYDVRLARWLPIASLIVAGNWLPLLSAMLAGIVWRREPTPLRRLVFGGGMLAAAGYALVYPLLGTVPECGDRWDGLGTCLQTTDKTCSPACAATLLRAYGIPATEQEMARLCLTRKGTSWQGLYRGLKLKTAGTPWDVEIVRCSSSQLAKLTDRPMIMSVGLERGARVDSELRREFGWVPGVNHSVVLTGFSRDGVAVVADPSIEFSREQWDRETLNMLWQGYAFRLVEREGALP
jgi:hypothetical protein